MPVRAPRPLKVDKGSHQSPKVAEKKRKTTATGQDKIKAKNDTTLKTKFNEGDYWKMTLFDPKALKQIEDREEFEIAMKNGVESGLISREEAEMQGYKV